MRTLKSRPELKETATDRLIHIDVLKIIAIIGVLIIHASFGGFYYKPLSAEYIFVVLPSCLVRFSVPVFIMCSGAVFLCKNTPVRNIYTKYILRIAAVLALAALFYECVDVLVVYIRTGVFDLSVLQKGVNNLLTFNTHFHLYYLYIIILMYALVPIVKTFLEKATHKQELYLLVFLFAAANLLPMLRCFFPFNRYFGGMTLQYSLNLSYGCLSYFFLGYYLNTHFLTKKQFALVLVSGIIGVLATFVCTTVYIMKNGVLTENFINAMSVNVYFTAAALFVAVKRHARRVYSERVAEKISIVSKSTFVIYLIHPFYNRVFAELGLTLSSFSVYLSFPLIVSANFLLSFITYLILSKVPWIKNVI